MSALTVDRLREQIGALLHSGVCADDQANLIEQGLDSLHLMRLVNQWRQAGAAVTFADLIEQPTLAHWLPRLTAAPRKRTDAVVDIDPTAPFALTDVQHAYWIGRGAEQVLGGVGCHAYLELDGTGLDPQRLAYAWQALQQRHGMLRARFDDEGRQQVLEHGRSALQVDDLRSLAPAVCEQVLLDVRQRLSHRLLAVDQGEVAGLHLSLLPEGRTRLHFDLDLLVADVHSLHVLLHDLGALYRGETLPDAVRHWHFGRYLAQRPAPSASAAAYWQARLDQLPAGPALPLAFEPETVQEVRFTRRQQRLPAEVWQRLRDNAAKRQLTPAMLLAGTFAQVLGRWSQEPHFLLNLPLFDRQGDEPGLDQVVADFTNLLLLEVDLRQPVSLARQLGQLQAQFHRDMAHAGYSGVQVQRDLALRGAGQRSFSPVVFACNLGTPLLGPAAAHTLGQLGQMISQTPQVWLDHQVYEEDGGLLLAWDAQDALFPPGLVDAMFGAYLQLLHNLQHEATWEAPALSSLPPLQQQVRAHINATATPIAPRTLLQAPFAISGERLALIHGERRISYAQLQQQALRIAAALLAQGVQPGEAVGVCLPRGHAAVLALYGVLAAGACYVPISPNQPMVRRERICHTASINTLIDPTWLADSLAFDPLPAPVSVSPDSPAYVIFTSGSTGEPKGVEVSHRAACNTLDDLNRRFGIHAEDRLLAVSALDFDLSVYDTFGVLAAGAAVVLLDETQRRDASAWNSLIQEHRVTLWNSVPLLLDMLLTVADTLPLRQVWLSGDWIGLDLPARLHQATAGHCRLIAMGGATEAAIWSNFQPVDLPLPGHWRSIPYGRPLGNQQYRVVDSLGRDCPDWMAGELWIGGAGVANGYRGAPQLSAERFVEHDGQRWYRTGDLGRYWPDGCLEFLGRRDQQVKVRGHRIELGEIENALLLQPHVRQAVALAVGTPLHLLAAVVATEGALCTEELRQQLGDHLPDFMLPNQWLLLDALPLSANGKLDRGALVQLAENTSLQHATANEAPCGEREQQVAAIWRELLPGAEVYRQSDFFRMGGDSLLATQCSARLRRAGLANAQSLRQLFATPRLADFVAQLQAPTAQGERQLLADPASRHQPFPLTEVQQAYWRGQNQGLPLSCGTTYLIELDGEALDMPRFERAWDQLIQRHEMLRAQLVDGDRQVILNSVPPLRVQLHQAPTADAARERLAQCWAQRPRQRHQWPMFEVHSVEYAHGRCRVGLFFDYLTLDGLSIKRLLAELALLYTRPDSTLPAIDLSFRDYVLQVQPDPVQLQQAEAWWQQHLDDLPGPPALPLHIAPQLLGEVHFSRREFRLPVAQWQALRQRARDNGVTASVLLLTVYAQVLARWSDGQAHTLNLTLFDRQDVHAHIGRVLGDFTALAPVSFYPVAQGGFLTQAQTVQAQVADVLQHAACSSIWVQRERARRVGPQAAALPVVFTSTLGLADDLLADLPDGFPDIAVGGLSETPQVWLDHQLFEHRGALVLCWDAVDTLFPNGLLDAAFACYTEALLTLVDSDWHQPLTLPLPAHQARTRQQANASVVPIAARTLLEAPFTIDGQRLALIDGERRVSYAQLRDGALRVAAWLQAQGVQPQDAIGVHLPRGTDAIIALFGVLAAGACYVPVGVRQPLERRQRIEHRAGIRLSLDADLMVAALRSEPLATPVSISVDSPAYVIFTSGSTGEPKGVQISHRAACNTLDDLNQRFGIHAEDRLLAVSSLDFDLSVYDVFGVLAVGGSLVLLDEEQRRDATVWRRLIHQHQITLWNSVPMLLDMLLTVADTLPLRQVWLSGDWIGLDLPARLHQATGGHCRLIAMGGATEAAIWSNFQPVDLPLPDHWQSIPYGRPLGNQCYRVVDTQARDCPDWVTGELWIGGAGVAMGYRGAPELSAERFVEHDGQRWYRTGDMGRYWPDGCLEFLGRRDQQVKVRGHRIELGEIDNALLACAPVRQALTVTLGHPPSLAAAVVVDADVSLEVLRQHLRQRLPDYMIPASLQVLEALPLSANGKADRNAVRECLLAGAAAHSDAPQGALEQEMAEVWEEILQRPIPGRQSDFFLLGGDSLSATRLVESLKRRRLCQVPLSLRELFAHPSIAALCDYLTSHTERPLHHHAEHFEEGTL